MNAIQRILHPTDFSACARGALGYALDLAVRFRAALHILHVMEEAPERATMPDPMRPAEVDLDIRLHETVNAQLGRLEQAELEHLNVEYSLGHDMEPGPAILRYADVHSVDLVVLGTHGRRGLRHLLVGSVATEVLHASRCDILIVRACEETAGTQTWGRRVLVPLDLTVASHQVLHEASALSDLFRAHLTLLHVIEPSPLPVFSATQGGDFEAHLPFLRQAARESLVRFREDSGLSEQTDLMVEVGSPAPVIADVAKMRDIDLIVMAARSRQQAGRFRLGSVTERVIRRAPCPVWVLRSHLAETLKEEMYQEVPEQLP